MKSRPFLSLALLVCALALSATGDEGKTDQPSERLKMLGQKIQAGKWAEARGYAKSQLQNTEKQAVEKYVLDVANDVLKQPRKQILSEYDFPYSDKSALK